MADAATVKAKAAGGGSRIPAGSVLLRAQPAVLTSDGGRATGSQDASIAVVPVMEGSVIRRLRIRCECGRTAEIECAYEENKEAP